MAQNQIVRDGSKKVKDVCVDFRTREDEALAQRLQDEEFETHYLRNRQERGTARVDVKTAKETYLEEVKKAGLLKEAEYQRIAEDDAWLAAELQVRLQEEEKMEAERRNAAEIQDEEYAYYLQQKEKQRLERVRQRRLQTRIEKERNEMEKVERERHAGSAAALAQEPIPITNLDDTTAAVSREDRREIDVSRDMNALTVSMPPPKTEGDHWREGAQGNNVDQSEYLAREQQLKDEEYARQLQRREEEKLQRMMEERDRRLALKMQRKEAEEYRRERAERQMRKAASMKEPSIKNDNDEVGCRQSSEGEEFDTRNNRTGDPFERRCSEQKSTRPVHREERRSHSIDHSSLESHRTYEDIQRPDATSSSKGGKEEIYQHEAANLKGGREFSARHEAVSSSAKKNSLERFQSNTPSKPDDVASTGHHDKHFVNVAACIDPTYKGDEEQEEGEQEEVPHWTERRWGLDEEDPLGKPTPVIQNTKRKRPSSKKSKEEKCKQQ